MKILRVQAENFCSYESIDFAFESVGLGLIYGKTGSGKSTIMDAVVWTLFGQTAKGGAVNDVVPVGQKGLVTKGKIELRLSNGKVLTVERIRNKSQNDLYFYFDETQKTRGVDVKETQKLLDKLLGVDYDTYVAGAYLNEFSLASTFFMARAKDRRELLERLSDLSLPIKLGEKVAAVKKALQNEVDQIKNKVEQAEWTLDQLRGTQNSTLVKEAQWYKEQAKAIAAAERSFKTWEQDQAARIENVELEIEALNSQREELYFRFRMAQKALDEWKQTEAKVCEECKRPFEDHERANQKEYQKLKDEAREAEYKLELTLKGLQRSAATKATILAETNHYLTVVHMHKSAKNPYTDELENIVAKIDQTTTVKKELTKKHADKTQKLMYANYTKDLVVKLRETLLFQAVSAIENLTNTVLEKHFDSEIRVVFAIDGDDIDVTILLNGHECAYSQLSKGQRGLLKLAFGVAVMDAVSANKGVVFENLFFDESLDGLDVDLKLKAFKVFQNLSVGKESVLVIDHSVELQNLFDRRYVVEKDQISHIYEE